MKIKIPVFLFLFFRIYTILTFVFFIFLFNPIRNQMEFFILFKESLCKWDCWLYTKIVESWYGQPWYCAFFPMFPLIVKYLKFLFGGDIFYTAFILSNIFCLVAVIFLYNLTYLIYSEKVALYTIVFFMASPTALFYSTFYTESLFLMLVTLFFLLLYYKKWFYAALVTGFATATRNVGIFLSFILVFEYFRNKKWIIKLGDYKIIFYFILSLTGIISFMIFLKIKYGDFFYFVKATQNWPERNGITFPFWDFFKWLKNITVTFQFKITHDRNNLSFLYILATLLLVIWGIKKIRLEHAIFLLLVLFIISVQPRIISCSRYLSSAFPVWNLLALFVVDNKRGKLLYKIILFVMLFWQFYINYRWINTYWVD
ncbi:MAG: hypothetical protein N3E50_10405 [Candidatus Goldbacteria bacterium]|nr:hypothetical protein [Candidatus Goldiibacteriota bacterium]